MMTSLLELVESLELGLTDPKAGSQKDSMKALLDGLLQMDVNTIDAKEVTHLVEFLVSRLVIGNPEVTSHLLNAFLWLARSVPNDGVHFITPTHASYICQKGLFGHLNIQSLSKSNRLRSFQLLHLFLHGPQLNGLKTMGHDFVFSYIQAIDGEKDPENLVLIFEMNLIVMENFPMERIAEDFFESMAVYFPIDFFPPPSSEASGITRPKLAELLHRCLFTSRTFAGPFLLPLLCEKADSGWPQAQVDSITLLADCLHGRLCSSTLESPGTYGPSIPLRHLSCFLVLVMPILTKMSTKSLSKEMMSSVIACFSGLVHSYSSQNATLSQMQDFVSILLKSFDIPVDCDSPRGNTELTDPPALPADQVIVCLSETLRACKTNAILAEILADKLISCFCNPLMCYAEESSDHVTVTLSKLTPSKPPFMLASRLLDAIPDTVSHSEHDHQVSLTSRLELVHCHLSHLLSTVYQWLVVDSANLPDSSHSLELHHLLDLISALVALSVRLHLSPLRSTALVNPTNLIQLSELLGYLTHHFGLIFLNLPPNCQQLTRDELCAAVSRMYSAPCPPAVDKLSELLFGQLQVTDEAMEQVDLALEILQRAALIQPVVLERLLIFLLNTASLAMEKSTINPVIKFVETLNFLSRSSLELAATELDKIVGPLQRFVSAKADTIGGILRLRTSQVYPTSLFNQLNSAFCVLTALSEPDEQRILLSSWQSQLLASSVCEPLLLAVWCGVLCGARPQALSLQNPLDLLTSLLDCLNKLDTAPDSPGRNLFALIAQAYGSVLNKCDEPLSTDICTAVSDAASRLWSLCAATAIHREFFANWLLSCLHSVLSHPGPSRLPLADQLLIFLLRPSDHISCLPEADMNSALNCLLSRLSKLGQSASIGSATSTVCHWQTTPLYSQKLHHLVAIPLALKVDSLMSSSNSAPPTLEGGDLRDAYLSAFLQIWSFMPDELLSNQLKKLLHYCLLAISSSTQSTTQFQGVRLLCNLIERVAIQPGQLTDCELDDLFTALPRIAFGTAAPNQTAAVGDVKSSALIRISIARCLCSLVHLPCSVISRHRESEVLPLLSRLIDDPNRAVRMEAARAQNAWLMLT